MNDDLKPQSFDLEAWRARMTQAQETEEERLARKAVQRRARELSMSTDALAWFMGLESKIAALETRLTDIDAELQLTDDIADQLESRVEALEHPKAGIILPNNWRPTV